MNFRVGMGFDVHQLAPGNKFILGGVELEFNKGPVAHSDGDVLIHAICDALLGAAALGDIGYHFPDNDSSLKGVDSKIILEKTLKIVRDEGFEVGNVDSTICLEKPKIAGYIVKMKEVLASVMKIDEGQISIKATTSEKMGFVGREEGVTAYAVALIYKIG